MKHSEDYTIREISERSQTINNIEQCFNKLLEKVLTLQKELHKQDESGRYKKSEILNLPITSKFDYVSDFFAMYYSEEIIQAALKQKEQIAEICKKQQGEIALTFEKLKIREEKLNQDIQQQLNK